MQRQKLRQILFLHEERPMNPCLQLHIVSFMPLLTIATHQNIDGSHTAVSKSLGLYIVIKTGKYKKAINQHH